MSNIREEIKARYEVLNESSTYNDMAVRKQLALEFADYFERAGVTKPYQMVCYYLRNRKKDGRKVYTTKELRQLVLMTAAEKQCYAERTGRSIQAVNGAVSRYKLASTRIPAPTRKADAARYAIDAQGFADMGNNTQLKVAGLNRRQIDSARRTLAIKYRLSLRAPNILYHPATGRRYYMPLIEQQAMFTGVDRYLRKYSASIKAGWQDGVQDPIDDDWSEPIDLDTVKHRRRAPKQPRALSLATALEKHIADHGLPQDLEAARGLYDSLIRLHHIVTSARVVLNPELLEV